MTYLKERDELGKFESKIRLTNPKTAVNEQTLLGEKQGGSTEGFKPSS